MKDATGQGDDNTTGCLLDYSYFKENYKLIVIDLSKQQELDTDPRAIQQIQKGQRVQQCFINAIPLSAKYSLIPINIKNDTIQWFKCKAKIHNLTN